MGLGREDGGVHHKAGVVYYQCDALTGPDAAQALLGAVVDVGQVGGAVTSKRSVGTQLAAGGCSHGSGAGGERGRTRKSLTALTVCGD